MWPKFCSSKFLRIRVPENENRKLKVLVQNVYNDISQYEVCDIKNENCKREL